MSDLQCPAVLLLSPAELSDLPEIGMSGRLAGVFVAASAKQTARATAERLAMRAGCVVEHLPTLRPGTHLPDALEHLADLHRGESLAVVAEAQQIQAALGSASSPKAVVVLTIDASGWHVGP